MIFFIIFFDSERFIRKKFKNFIGNLIQTLLPRAFLSVVFGLFIFIFLLVLHLLQLFELVLIVLQLFIEKFHENVVFDLIMFFLVQKMPVIQAYMIGVKDWEEVLKQLRIEHQVMKDGFLQMVECFGRGR